MPRRPLWHGCLQFDGGALLRFAVLDEADEMLSMGFQEDVEKIVGQVTGVRTSSRYHTRSAARPTQMQRASERESGRGRERARARGNGGKWISGNRLVFDFRASALCSAAPNAAVVCDHPQVGQADERKVS